MAGYITASERRFAPDVVFALRPRLDSSTHQVSTDTPELDSYSWNSQYCLFSFILGITLSLFTPELDSYSFFRFSFRQGSVFLLKFNDKSNISFPVKYFQIGIDNKDLLSWNSVARFNCPYFCYCLTRLVMDIFLKYEVNSCNWRLWLFDGSNDLSRILSQATWGIQDAVQCKYTITNT